MSYSGNYVPEPVGSFLSAVNAHDENAFRDSFTEDSIVDDWGQVVVGRSDIENWSERAFIGSSPTFNADDIRIGDGHVTVIGDWRSDHANGPSRFDFDVDGGRITKMTVSEG
ncbi:nuclear transport factor 2 family protein [Corynebacterium sp.]|uniref:nuclear transport factor 2 family protein n=1 Tax=Corynebacterium sp. TaxID=1720 RepID=UPI003B3BE19F